MTLSATNNRVSYTGNDAVSIYAYTFRIISETDLLVTVKNLSSIETTLSLSTDYTVSGVGEFSGGDITLVNSGQPWLTAGGNLLSGFILVIRRIRPLTQLTDIRNQGDFFPEIHEDEFDSQIMIDQQQQDELDRSIKLSETTDPATFGTELPAAITQAASATKVIVVNSTFDGFDLGPTTTDIANAQSNASAAAASAAAAATSETNAATSEANAAATLASAFFRDTIYVDNTDSPITVSQSDNGKFYVCDTSSGAITFNLPQISTLTLPFNLAAKIGASGNVVTFNRAGTDTIDGNTTKSISSIETGFQLSADTDNTPDEWNALNFGIASEKQIITVGTNYTVQSSDEVIIIDPEGSSFTATLPSAVGLDGKEFIFKRIDETQIVVSSRTFVDGDVTVGTDTITATNHGFTNLHRVQFTTTGTLPTGLSLATNYYTIVVDTNNFKVASNRDNAAAGVAVDITAASGGGVHTVTPQTSTVTIEADGTETIDNFLNLPLNERNDYLHVIANNGNYRVLNSSISPTLQEFTSPVTAQPYTLPNGVKRLKITASAGGGGGAGGDTTAAVNGSNGTTTSVDFVNYILSLSGGVGGQGERGGNSITVSPPFTFEGRILQGSSPGQNAVSAADLGGGGGPGLGKGGRAGGNLENGFDGIRGGGGGGGGSNVGIAGGGGASGGHAVVEVIYPLFDSTHTITYTVGSGGAGGVGDTTVGGDGGDGFIIFEEFYQ